MFLAKQEAFYEVIQGSMLLASNGPLLYDCGVLCIEQAEREEVEKAALNHLALDAIAHVLAVRTSHGAPGCKRLGDDD